MVFDYKPIIGLKSEPQNKSTKKDGTPRKNARIYTRDETKKTKELSIREKICLIEYSQTHTVRDTAKEFKVGVGTVVNIKKRKEEYAMLGNEESICADRKRKFRHTPYDELNRLCWTWLSKSRSMNIPLSGPIIQETARKFAAELKLPAFKGSNGWLGSFTKAHNINLKVFSSEEMSGEDDAGVKFLHNLKNICKDYQPRDIFNVDETDLCWRALPERSWVETQKHNKGANVVREKVVVLLAVSAVGEKLAPVVVGRISWPQSMKGVDLQRYDISYQSNNTAWMTSNIFHEWLQSTNNKFLKENRKVLLFLPSSSFHPFVGLPNITLCFLPPSSSFLQPLDHGIISTFKTNYRTSLLKHIIVALDLRISSKVVLFDMLMWIRKAWQLIPCQSIINAFCHSGFKFNAEPLIVFQQDPTAELNELINQAHSLYLIKEKLSAEDFHKLDEELQVLNGDGQDSLFSEGGTCEDDEEVCLDSCIDHHIAMLHVRELKHFSIHNEATFVDDILNVEEKLHDAIVGSQRFTLNEFFY